ncbi:hypothetical protein JL720_15283 [Aureococcus anophagefferens]|nr:hypothetical protein JL720_15283 [Aureococcus anophagefferens]
MERQHGAAQAALLRSAEAGARDAAVRAMREAKQATDEEQLAISIAEELCRVRREQAALKKLKRQQADACAMPRIPPPPNGAAKRVVPLPPLPSLAPPPAAAFDAGSAAHGCKRILDADRAFLRSLGHIHAVGDDGVSEMERIGGGAPEGEALEWKIRRDQLQDAVENTLASPSVYTLWWGIGIINKQLAAKGRQKKHRAVAMNATLLSLIVMTVAAQVMLPLLILAGYKNPRLPYALCRATRCKTVTAFSTYHLGVYIIGPGASPRPGAGAKAGGASMADLVEVFQRDEDGLILYVAAEVQLLSYKLVLLASVYLFFTQSTIADIIMNSLSLQFLLSLDNTVTSAVRHAPTVAKEMASWFDGYDWLSHRTTSYLVDEKKTGAFEVLGVRIRPFRLIPFISYDLSIDRDWFKQHPVVCLISMTDVCLLPIIVYFVVFVGTCADEGGLLDDDD